MSLNSMPDPVVMKTVEMKEKGLPLSVRFQEFPWMLGDLIFPFMMEYMLVWYLIWETILNILAELTYFADRSFYDAWWNSGMTTPFAPLPLLLQTLIGNSILGPVRARLEPPRTQLSPPSCLPQLYLVAQSQQAHRDSHHFFYFSMYS